MTTLLLIRHGQSQANLEHYFAGNLDPALTALGHQQAAATAAFLQANYSVDAVYASDLLRALDTGRALGLPVREVPALREIHAGIWQGKTFDQLQTDYADSYQVWLTDIGNCHCPGGESVADLAARVYDAVAKIAGENPGKTVAIATHATPIRALQWHMTGKPLSHMKQIPWVTNASVTELRWEKGELSPVKISMDDHLQDMKTQFPPNV